MNTLISASGRLSRFMQRELSSELERFSLGLGEFRVVGLLLDEPAGLTQNELSERLGVTAPTLSVAVRDLEQRGVVKRRTDPEDARRKRVVLAGRTRIKPVMRMLEQLEGRITAGVCKEDLATTLRVLRQVSDTLEQGEATQ